MTRTFVAMNSRAKVRLGRFPLPVAVGHARPRSTIAREIAQSGLSCWAYSGVEPLLCHSLDSESALTEKQSL
jgi:hypothetical protein